MRIISKHKSQHTMADELSISVGKINHIVKALVEKGLVKVGNFMSNDNKTQYLPLNGDIPVPKGKVGCKYLLTKKGIKEKITMTKNFIEIRKNEYKQLQEELDKYDKGTI
jgi:DNA-binding transcriptional regulator LsrR (DeoR family)